MVAELEHKTAAGQRIRPRRRARVAERYGLILLVLAMVVVFSTLPETGEAFRSMANIRALLANQAVGLTVAVALLFPMAAGYFDFSVGAVMAAASVVAASALSSYGLP